MRFIHGDRERGHDGAHSLEIKTSFAAPSHRARKILALAMNYHRHPEAYGPVDREVLSKFIDLDKAIGDYSPLTADSVKVINAREPDLPSEDYSAYFDLWLSKASDYPADYLDAALTLVAPLFSAGHMQPLFNSSWHTWNVNYLPESVFEKPPFQSFASEHLGIWYSWLRGLPIVNVGFMACIYAVILPAFLVMAVALSGRRNGVAIVLVPIGMTFAGLVLSPVLTSNAETTRYLLPLISSAPLMVSFSSAMPASHGNNPDKVGEG